jgi:hypothetical protein
LIGLYANTWPTPGSNNFQVNVYQADGPDGAPGTQLFTSGVLTGTRGSWNYVPINTPIIDFDFYIFYIQPDTYPNCPGMALDAKLNSPDGYAWTLQDGIFAPGDKGGDWMIRAVIDYTQQTNNVGPMYFGSLPKDTIPNINLSVQVSFKNFSTTTYGPGVPVRMQITGPEGYVRNYATDTTTGTWPPRGIKSVTYRPPWHLPDTAGNYVLKVWTDLPTDEYRGNDTMVRTVSAAKWYNYANFSIPYWITWANPMRATLFHPADFGLGYPLDISRMRAEFYWDATHLWNDSLFQFALYNENGDSLWMSDTIRARNYPSLTDGQVSPTISIPSGDFYATVIPHGGTGHPITLADSTNQGHSWYGSPNTGWVPWNLGELFIAISARTNLVGIAEGGAVPAKPRVVVMTRPNPSVAPLICWQIPSASPVRISIYDASGREARTLNVNRNAQALSGSVRMTTDNLAPGIYLVKLNSGSYTASTKLVVAR